jgi:hypothetical protein
MKIGANDQARVGRDEFFKLRRNNAKVVLESAMKAFYLRAQIQRDCKHRLISRLLKQNLVAGIDQCRHREVVCESRSRGCHNLIRSHPIARRNQIYERFISVTTVGNLEIVE